MTEVAGRLGRRCRRQARALRARHARRDTRRAPLALVLRTSGVAVHRPGPETRAGAPGATGPAGRTGAPGPVGRLRTAGPASRGAGPVGHTSPGSRGRIALAGPFVPAVRARRAAGPPPAGSAAGPGAGSGAALRSSTVLGAPRWRAGPPATPDPAAASGGAEVAPDRGRRPAVAQRTAPATAPPVPDRTVLRTTVAAPVRVRRRVETPESRGAHGGPMSGGFAAMPAAVVRRVAPAPVERPEPAPVAVPPPAVAAPDVDRITEQVVREIDRRFVAHRERRGRG